MTKTVRIACVKSPCGYYVQDVDKVPVGSKIYVSKSTTKVKTLGKLK